MKILIDANQDLHIVTISGKLSERIIVSFQLNYASLRHVDQAYGLDFSFISCL